MTTSVRVRQWSLLTGALPRVAPWRPLFASATFATLFILRAANPSSAALRLRLGGAVVAACVAFALDDTAETTLASAPTTLLARRSVRVLGALAALAGWWCSTAALADATTGLGRPPSAVGIEILAIAAIALATSSLASSHGDDGTGGFAGASVALACFATSYLPPRWWWPLAPDPSSTSGMRRLAVLLTVAVVFGVAASLDPARRRRPA